MTQFSALQHEAEGLSAGLPPLMVEADHLAASVSLGVHGRRKAGMGESFWQFRRYASHDSSTAIDWRQSAKSQHHLRARARMGSGPDGVVLARRLGQHELQVRARVSKRARADLLLLALASLLVRGGERVGFVGMEGAPAASRLALTRMGRAMFAGNGDGAAAAAMPFARGNQLVWFSDFLDDGVIETMKRLSRQGVEGHLVRIVDPAEEDFPYSGRTRFESPPRRARTRFSAAPSASAAPIAPVSPPMANASPQAAAKLGWTCTVHRTDHAPQASLIALHAAIGGT